MVGKFCRCNTGGLQKALPIERLQVEAKESYIAEGSSLPEVMTLTDLEMFKCGGKKQSTKQKKKKKTPILVCKI